MASEAFDNVHILIVAGKTCNVRLLRGILSALGTYDIRVAPDTSRALDLLARRDFQIVFCDGEVAPLDMPAFVRAVRSGGTVRNSRIPILITATALKRSQVEGMRDTGVNDLLVLPLTGGAVERKLRGALASAKSFVEAESYVGPDRRRPKDRRRAPTPVARASRQERRAGRLRRRRTDIQN